MNLPGKNKSNGFFGLISMKRAENLYFSQETSNTAKKAITGHFIRDNGLIRTPQIPLIYITAFHQFTAQAASSQNTSRKPTKDHSAFFVFKDESWKDGSDGGRSGYPNNHLHEVSSIMADDIHSLSCKSKATLGIEGTVAFKYLRAVQHQERRIKYLAAFISLTSWRKYSGEVSDAANCKILSAEHPIFCKEGERFDQGLRNLTLSKFRSVRFFAQQLTKVPNISGFCGFPKTCRPTLQLTSHDRRVRENFA